MIQIKSDSLRHELLRIGVYQFGKEMKKNHCFDTTLSSIKTKLDELLPQRLALFRSIRDAPGAEEKANYAHVCRTVEMIEHELHDFGEIRKAMEFQKQHNLA